MKKVLLSFIMIALSFYLTHANENKSQEVKFQVHTISQNDTLKLEKSEKSSQLCLVSKYNVDERRGCCSHHGGVSQCDSQSGMMRCNDGTLSPSCTCNGY